MDRRIKPSRWRNARLRWALLGLALLILVVGLARLLPPPGSLAVKAADLEVGVVHSASFQDYLPVRAEVAPLKTVLVSAVTGGQVADVLVLDGAEVTKGMGLATLSNPQLRLDVTTKEADIAGRLSDSSAQALSLERNRLDRDKEVSETRYSLLKAQHDLDVRKQLHDQGFVSDAEVKTFGDEAAYYSDRLKTLRGGQKQEGSISNAQNAQIQQTNARLQSSLDVVRSSLDALTIRAPTPGRLTDFTLQAGQSLKAGDQVGQIDSEGEYKLAADVDEFYLGRVAPGQNATANLSGQTSALKVSRVLPQVSNGRFRAELVFAKAPSTPLRRGESVDVRITLGDTQPALVLSNGAWLEGSGGASAFVLSDNGHTAVRRNISIGRRNPDQVEVTGGLHPGDRVVISNYANFEKFNTLILK